MTTTKAVEIDLNGARIAALLTRPAESTDRYVVFVHGGPGGTMDGPAGLFIRLAGLLADQHIASVRFDMLASARAKAIMPT